jgi:hypothetical protein
MLRKIAKHHWTRRKFLSTAAALPAVHLATTAHAADSPKAVGPILGHVDHQRALIWYRPTEADKYVAKLIDGNGNVVGTRNAMASPDNDLCVSWSFADQSADETYRYEIHRDNKPLVAGPQFHLHTAPPITAEWIDMQGKRLHSTTLTG